MMIIYGILFLFNVLTLVNIITMPNFKVTNHHLKGTVSVLIPMRNEEKNAYDIIQSIKKINYENLEVIILDDQSTDSTEKEIVRSIAGDGRFRVIKGKSLPDKWVGKVHACHQLSEQATGDYYLFLDADVRVEKEVVNQSLHVLEKYESKLVTGFPRFPVRPFLGKLLVPLQHFFIFFHLPNWVANRTTWSSFTAAHGAFMFFEKNAYESIGGHQAVKGSLIEDIHITRMMKAKGYKATIANITTSVTCFMYDKNRDVWQGFLKNIYVGLGRSPIMAIGVTMFYSLIYAGPLFLALGGFWIEEWAWGIPLLLIWLQKAIIDFATKQDAYLFVLMPLSAIALIVLLWTSMMRDIRNKGYEWKGRVYK